MDEHIEALLAKRAETLATVQYLLNYIRSVVESLQAKLEFPLHDSSHEVRLHEAVNEEKQSCNCCGPNQQRDSVE